MPRIPEEIIERIKDATDIVDLVSEHVRLTRRGASNFFGLCPFHEEKTPSFSVNTERQIYHCFGCGAGGNVFRFLQEIDHISFIEAVQHLAQRAGLPIPSTHIPNGQDGAHDALYRANDLAKKYFQHILQTDPRGRQAAQYLRERGLSEETLEHFGVGCAPAGWDNLLKVCTRRGLSADILERAGLAQARRQGSGHYDRFRDRVTFPITGASGRTIGFGARALRPEDQPKYLNSPETAIYHKSSVLYGLSLTRAAIREAQVALVVEGYMDLLSLYQHGIAGVVASAGTALTMDQCRLLSRAAPRVVLIFDGDAAGSAAAVRGLEVLVAAGLDARVVSLPEGHDPDTFVQTEGAGSLRDLIAQAQDVLSFYLDHLANRHDLHSVQGRARALDAFQPLLLKMGDPVQRDLLLKEVAQRLGIDERAVRQQLQQEAGRQRRSRQDDNSAARATRTGYTPPPPEKAFLGLLLKFPRFIDATAARLGADAFTDPGCRRLATLLFSRRDTAAQLDLSLLMNELEDEALIQLLSECAMLGYDEKQIDRQWEDHLRHLRIQQLAHEIRTAEQALQEAKAQADESRAMGFFRQLAELNRKRQALMAEQNS